MSPQFKLPLKMGVFLISTEFQVSCFRSQTITAGRFVETICNRHLVYKLILQNIKVRKFRSF